MTVPHVLILGGTGEARLLAQHLAREPLRVTLSLAGRTASPLPQAGEVRTGGFGGAEGLAAFLKENDIGVLVDATHPFAARISDNAEAAARLAGVPLVVLERPRWGEKTGDCWLPARDMDEAAALLGEAPRIVFLAVGRQELEPFSRHPQHAYVVRSVDPVDEGRRILGARYVLGRGPFAEEDERALLLQHGIELVVAKNSGGEATYGKIAAARKLGLPVVMVARPRLPDRGAVGSVGEAVERILHLADLPAARGE